MLHRNIGDSDMARNFDPFAAMRESMRAYAAWSRFAATYTRMQMSAAEVIARRTTMMAQGVMTHPEAVRMVLEKPATLAFAAEKAMTAAARGGDMATVAHAALRPIGRKTAANARRLRK
jgi:hypothetical protein